MAETGMHQRRIADAQQGLEGDPAVEARLAEVDAALAHEGGQAPIDDFEIRIGGSNDADSDGATRVLTRIPVPDPRELRAERSIRSAETETALSRLEETSLERRAQRCFRSVVAEAHGEHALVYETYAEQQSSLLRWNAEWRASGALNERTAARFEIESRIKLASRMPEPTPPPGEDQTALPAVEAPTGRLVLSPALVQATVGDEHPSVAVRQALAERYDALSDRADSRGRIWFDFVDVAWTSKQNRANEVSGQVALRVPIGPATSAESARLLALGRSELRRGRRITLDQTQLGLLDLQQIDRFEANTARWQELLELAREAETMAGRWESGRLANPSQVAALYEQAYDARSVVLDARERAGQAACRLLSVTGVLLDDWPRLAN